MARLGIFFLVFAISVGLSSWYGVKWSDSIAAYTGYAVELWVPSIACALVFGAFDWIAVRWKLPVAVNPVWAVAVVAAVGASLPTLLAIWVMSQPEV